MCLRNHDITTTTTTTTAAATTGKRLADCLASELPLVYAGGSWEATLRAWLRQEVRAAVAPNGEPQQQQQEEQQRRARFHALRARLEAKACPMQELSALACLEGGLEALPALGDNPVPVPPGVHLAVDLPSHRCVPVVGIGGAEVVEVRGAGLEQGKGKEET